MASADKVIHTYRELAESYERQGQDQMRDRFLVLAADAAQSAGRMEIAERLRSRLLQLNPQHLLKEFGSFAEAMQTQDVQNYVAALRRNHPFERAEHLLQGLRPSQSADSPASAHGPDLPLDRRMREQPGESSDELKIFRVQQTDAPLVDPLRGRSLTSSPDPGAKRRQGVHPQPRERNFPPVVANRVPADSEDPEPAFGKWLVLALFWLMLGAGMFLTVVTFLRPFWHRPG
jgi:hypothetical protein